MTPITINGIDINYPRGWDELSWGQFMAIQNLDYTQPDHRIRIEVVSILTGIDVEDWKRSTDIETYTAIASNIDWVFSTDLKAVLADLADKPFRRVSYEGKEYTMPLDPGALPVAMFEDAKVIARDYFAILAESEGDDTKIDHASLFRNIKNLFRIYFQYVKDGEYNYMKASELNIDSIPFIIAIRWKDFFLNGLLSFSTTTPGSSTKSNRPENRLLRIFRSFRKITGFPTSFTN